MSTPASSKPKNLFKQLLHTLQQDYPSITFKEADSFYWSAENQTVFYSENAEAPAWLLLHEIGHMVNEHTGYSTDLRLVHMELQAWETARALAERYGIPLDEEYIEDCLDSYRHWQYKRSLCPRCNLAGVEKSSGLYRCINCRQEWRVTVNRFCRAYRKKTPH
jgi:hypothetical protein